MRYFTRFNFLATLLFALCLSFGIIPVMDVQAADCLPVTGGLSWDAHPETDVTKFNIYQSDVSPTDLQDKLGVSPMASLANSPLTMVDGRPTYMFKVADLVNNKSYFYAVSAVNSKGKESGLSNIVTCTVSLAPQPPTDLQLK